MSEALIRSFNRRLPVFSLHSYLIDSITMKAEDEADSSPLVCESALVENLRRRIPRRRQIDEGFHFLSASQLVGLFIAAFLVGALCPMLVFMARDQRRGDDTRAPTEPQIWNNLRNVARNNHANQTSGSSTANGGVKLAWRK